jgi:hypothetical protein
MSDEKSWYERTMRRAIERHISPATGEIDMDATLAELKVDFPDEHIGNLESIVATWMEQDYPPTQAQIARQNAQRRQAKINDLRAGRVEAWLSDDDLF